MQRGAREAGLLGSEAFQLAQPLARSSAQSETGTYAGIKLGRGGSSVVAGVIRLREYVSAGYSEQQVITCRAPGGGSKSAMGSEGPYLLGDDVLRRDLGRGDRC